MHVVRHASPPSGVRVATPDAGASPGGSTRPPITEEVLLAEADRLAMEAVRLGEEAKAAAAVAVRKTSMAKFAGEAASIAAEAVRIVSTAGVELAGRRLQEALAMEEALRRGDPIQQSPTGVTSVGRNGTQAMPSAVADYRSLGPMSAGSSVQQMLPDPNHPIPYDHTGPMRAVPDPGLIEPFKSTFDPQMFRAQLKPEILGMPRPVAIALFVALFVAFIILLWVVV